MLFNSVTFFVFLAIVLPLYYRLKHRGQNWLLLTASYIFYGWWDPRFLLLLVGSSVFDYYCGIWIEDEHNPKRKKWLLAGSMIVNMGVLCAFKYFNFFMESLKDLFTSFGFSATRCALWGTHPSGDSGQCFRSSAIH